MVLDIDEQHLWDEYRRTGDATDLMNRWGAYAWTVAWSRRLFWMTPEAIKQESQIALWNAITRYVRMRGASFRTYLVKTIRGLMLNMAPDG